MKTTCARCESVFDDEVSTEVVIHLHRGNCKCHNCGRLAPDYSWKPEEGGNMAGPVCPDCGSGEVKRLQP